MEHWTSYRKNDAKHNIFCCPIPLIRYDFAMTYGHLIYDCSRNIELF